eukprot:g10101.t1
MSPWGSELRIPAPETVGFLDAPYFSWWMLLLLSGRYAAGQADECAVEEAPPTGSRNEDEMSFTCANESFVSAIFFNSYSFGFRGMKVECSTGEQSDWMGSQATDVESAECSGGWTEMSTSPEDAFGYPADAYLFCYNEDRGYPDGTWLGPFGEDTDSIDEITVDTTSSCEQGSYAVGVIAHGTSARLHGFQLLCRPNNPPSCPTPEGLLVPAVSGASSTDSAPTVAVTPGPIPTPTLAPSTPTVAPFVPPTPGPIPTPTLAPLTPTVAPLVPPTPGPIPTPTLAPLTPTVAPFVPPTPGPIPTPTVAPLTPTMAPFVPPTPGPTSTPTVAPLTPTVAPAISPTPGPTSTPTVAPLTINVATPLPATPGPVAGGGDVPAPGDDNDPARTSAPGDAETPTPEASPAPNTSQPLEGSQADGEEGHDDGLNLLYTVAGFVGAVGVVAGDDPSLSL